MGGGSSPAAGTGLRFQARFKSRIQPVISLENFVRTGKRQANGQPAQDRSQDQVGTGLESVHEERLPKTLRTSVKAKRDVRD
ncbi:hypothetical protein BSZ18_14135 [Bradyrhizobium canariense]|uniref:Uncharacterized protein n=1 Tax=Bradyrhizobium canariense TaxID=255045 RepID=A0A1X3GKY0_9BRAD|nr:hypothetical protein BST65_09105 [Bradyrhizobium canariense]OSI33767.1 hypothetical protein BST66_12430 [Bradyrhizobium canariense]OSI44721.1 hypothetical protein BSZ20_13880 [Bradyrhizobium canariense]OSI51651.1 hypothetical protein BST67_12130 [Bradyrhizobium canariense]OSI55336.1 hypothetical protein BSZ15_20265 [Bradyrhizobium canariense]